MARNETTNRAAAETPAGLMGLRLDASGRCTFRLKDAPGTLVQVRVVDVPKEQTSNADCDEAGQSHTIQDLR